jgi:peptide/nickel transport system substrate-binding protein
VKGKNPFKDVRVRKALNMAIDREAIKRVTMRGLSIPAALMIPPGVHGYDKKLDAPFKYDIAGAKKLLAEAGYPDGFEFTLDCPNNRYVNDEKICQALVAMWAKAGIRAKLNSVQFSNFIPKILNFDPASTCWAVVAPSTACTRCSRWCAHKTTGADGSFNLGRVSDGSSTTHRRDQDRHRPGGARRAAARGTAEDARRGLLRAAAPPDAALGDEEGGQHLLQPGRPPAGALRHR